MLKLTPSSRLSLSVTVFRRISFEMSHVTFSRIRTGNGVVEDEYHVHHDTDGSRQDCRFQGLR